MPRRKRIRCKGGYYYRTKDKCPDYQRNVKECFWQKCPWHVSIPRIQRRWERREEEIAKFLEKQIADAKLDEILADGTRRYVKLVTVRSHPQKGKYRYGRIQIETDPDLIGKEVGIIILVPPFQRRNKEKQLSK